MTETPPTTRSPGSLQRVVRFPLTRLVLALAFVIVGGIVGSFFRNVVASGLSLDEDSPARGVLSMFVLIPTTFIAYWIYVRVIERRPVRELARSEALKELGLGVLVGGALFTAVVGAIAACGSYRILGVNPLTATLPIFTASVIAGSVEELVVRGIIFRIMEEGLGTWAALAITAALFGALHLGNPGATWISSVSIALTAGVLLGATYVVTRRLWLAIGLHFAWNYTQGGIFGVAVSGHPVDGLFRAELSGPEWIAGGAFGAEASIFAVLFCVPLAVYLLVRCHRSGQLVRPMWKRRG